MLTVYHMKAGAVHTVFSFFRRFLFSLPCRLFPDIIEHTADRERDRQRWGKQNPQRIFLSSIRTLPALHTMKPWKKSDARRLN